MGWLTTDIGRKGVLPARALTSVALVALLAGLALVPRTASPFAQRWEPLTPLSAGYVAGFILQPDHGAAPVSRSDATTAARASAGAGFALGDVQAEATLFHAVTGHPHWTSENGNVALMAPDLPLPMTYPSAPYGSHLNVWLVAFAPVYLAVVGAPGQTIPQFRALYVVVDAATDRVLVTFAAARRL